MSKKPDFERIYNHIWNQYTFLYNERRRIDNQITFLTTLNGILLFVFFALFGEKIINQDLLFYSPLIFFLTSLLISLYNQVSPKKIWVPWFGKGSIKHIFDQQVNKGESKDTLYKNFYEAIAKSTLANIKHITGYDSEKNRIFFYSLNFLIIGIMLSILLPFLKLIEVKMNLCLSSIILILISFAIFKLNKRWFKSLSEKEYVKEDPNIAIDKFFDEWK